MIFISLLVEKLLGCLGQRLKKKERKSLYKALKRIKAELMLMGFMSLLLAVFQDDISYWCIPEKLVSKWLPCKKGTEKHRRFAEKSASSSCAKGKVLIKPSPEFFHALHYLIFILAVVQVVTCTLTVLLGELKIRQWWKWEEIIQMQYDTDHGSTTTRDRVIHVRNASFIKNRFTGIDANKPNWVISFLKHLYGSVTKSDYTAMRSGFILTHCRGNLRFNFFNYMVYAYESDFQKVVGISWYLWLFVVITFIFNVGGWHIYFWTEFVPLVLLLAVGTKLEQVITELAIYIGQRHSAIIGEVRIQPSDEYFWFHRPQIVLLLTHVILFLNSVGIAIFFWIKFVLNSSACIMDKPKYICPRVAIMVVMQTICSYSTLPLYAIVTQMGSSYHSEAMEKSGHSRPHMGPKEVPNDTAASVQMSNL